MNLTLTRNTKEVDGIFSTLTDENGKQVAVTLEHAYDAKLGNGSYTAKIQPGVYKCVRGTHQLHNLVPFETFEVTGVTGCVGILFHAGNYNNDSQGCILLGRSVLQQPGMVGMITNSRDTFGEFMDLQRGLDSFSLTVKD